MEILQMSDRPLSSRMLLGRPSARWLGQSEKTGEGWGYQSCWFSHDVTAANRYPICEVYDTPMMEAYQKCFEASFREGCEFVGMIHDDLSIYEMGWDLRVLEEFEDPEVGAVGFFGAFSHCQPQLYDEPCKPVNFTRSGVVSNLRRDAHFCGERYTGSCDVAVFDGLALFIRRDALVKINGWPVGTAIQYWAYDYWLSMELRRIGYRLRVVGIDCDHWSGKGMPIAKQLAEAVGKINPCGDEAHILAHQYLYDLYKGTGVIPYTVVDQHRKEKSLG